MPVEKSEVGGEREGEREREREREKRGVRQRMNGRYKCSLH